MQRFRPVELAAGPFRLRLARDADVDAALEMSRDPAIAQWYSTGVVDRRSARRWLRNGADWSGGTHATWVVADATDRLVGNFSMVSIDLEDLSAQMSYRTAPGPVAGTSRRTPWARRPGGPSTRSTSSVSHCRTP